MLLGSRGLSPLSGLICEIVNSAGQGNFTFVKKSQGKVKELQKPLAGATMLFFSIVFLTFFLFLSSPVVVS